MHERSKITHETLPSLTFESLHTSLDIYKVALNHDASYLPVIEIDGPRASGKGTQVAMLSSRLMNINLKTSSAKISGFIDSPDEMITYATLNSEFDMRLYHKIMQMRLARSVIRGGNGNVQEADLLQYQEEFGFTQLGQTTEKGLGEYSWMLLQAALLDHLDNTANIVIADGGRISRLYSHLKYIDVALSKNPYEVTYNDRNEILPLPAMTLLLSVDEKKLIKRAENDDKKPEYEKLHRVDSIGRNFIPFNNAVEVYGMHYPENVCLINANGSVEETHERIVDALRENGVLDKLRGTIGVN